MSDTFKILSATDLTNKVEIKEVSGKKLSYVSWANAWLELQKLYPDSTFEIERFGDNKSMYLFDENLGYMVSTKMVVNGVSHGMTLPVLDNTNKAMRHVEYQSGSRTVKPATMFDINTAIMRCLVKNISLYGLGLYLYAGEDLPESEVIIKQKEDFKDYTFSAGVFEGKRLNDIQDVEGLTNILAMYRKQMGAGLSAAVEERIAFLSI